MKDRIFYSVCFGFVLGILVRSLFFIDIYVTAFLGVIGMALFLFFTLVSKYKWGVIASIFILVFSVGIFRFDGVEKVPPEFFESKAGERISLNGIIVDEPDKRENNQKLTIEVIEDKDGTKILATTSLEEEYKYGDEIKFSGRLDKPENFITDQGKEFDYINYLRKEGIYYVMNYVTIDVTSEDNGNFIKSILFSLKAKFLEKIDLNIREPESLLMGGLILGERASFSKEMRQKFIDTGTIHIVALSGYNVTIVAEWIVKMFSFLPYKFAFSAGILGIFFFVVMAGAQSTAVRAGVMASLAVFARATGRNYDVGRALLLAGSIMIAVNPFVLAYDVSFQLSFIATVAVIFFSPRIEKYFLWITPKFGLRDIVSVTTSAYLFVLPFILYKMGNLSMVALPANILVLPFIPVTMFFGFITGVAGIIWYVLAIPFGYISYLFLHYELGVIDFISQAPYASFSIPNFPLIFVILIYAYFIHMLFGRSIKKFFTSPL